MKQMKFWNVICAVLWVLLLAVEAVTFYMVFRLHMLPDQYLMLLGGGLLFLGILMGLLLLPGRNTIGGLRRGIAAFLILVICVGCAVVSTVLADVYDTMHGVLGGDPGEEIEKTTRSIYVMANDPAQTMADLKGYSFAVVENFDTANVQQVIDALAIAHGRTPETKAYATMTDMADALYSGEVKAIIVDEANLMILEIEEGYENFRERARLLCQVEIQEQLPPPPTTEPTTPDHTDPTGESPVPTEPEVPTEPAVTVPVIEKPEDITNTPFLVYVAGSDTRTSTLINKTRNDVNILVVVNPNTKQILMINTPRDYFVKNPVGNNARDKLSHCGVWGVQNSIDAMSLLYGDRIDYYAQINFVGFETFIDAIGGVTVYSEKSFTAGGTVHIKKGENNLNGAEALAFARERYALADGDQGRGNHQMKVIRAVIEKMTSGTTLITRYADILNSLSGMFKTNLTMEELGMLVKMQLNDMSSWNIMTYAVSGTGDMQVCYSAPGQDLWVMWPDYKMVAHATDLIDRVISGEILTAEDLK